MQGPETGAVGAQCGGQAVFGDQEVDEEVHPAREGGVRCRSGGQQGRSGLDAGVDLVPVDGDDEVGPGGEVPVERAHADAGPGRDVAHGRVHSRGDEDLGGRVQQRLLIAPGVLAPGPGHPCGAVVHRGAPFSHIGGSREHCEAEQRSVS